MITTLRPVPRGTDGGVSVAGTFAGVAGLAGDRRPGVLAGLYPAAVVAVVTAAGVAGNLADSLLGAILEKRGLLDNEGVNFAATLCGALAAAAGAGDAMAFFLSVRIEDDLAAIDQEAARLGERIAGQLAVAAELVDRALIAGLAGVDQDLDNLFPHLGGDHQLEAVGAVDGLLGELEVGDLTALEGPVDLEAAGAGDGQDDVLVLALDDRVEDQRGAVVLDFGDLVVGEGGGRQQEGQKKRGGEGRVDDVGFPHG